MKIYKIYFLLFSYFFIFCKTQEFEDDKYEIINLIYTKYSNQQLTFFVFPIKRAPNPNNPVIRNVKKNINKKYEKLSKKDSLNKIKSYLKNQENKQIFAFETEMIKYHNKERKINKEKIIDFDKLYNKFIKSKHRDFLNISKINPHNNDSIVSIDKISFNKLEGIEFKRFDVFISFSNLVFDNTRTKAIINCTIGFSKTDFHSKTFFLEKNKKKWKIKYKRPI